MVDGAEKQRAVWVGVGDKEEHGGDRRAPRRRGEGQRELKMEGTWNVSMFLWNRILRGTESFMGDSG